MVVFISSTGFHGTDWAGDQSRLTVGLTMEDETDETGIYLSEWSYTHAFTRLGTHASFSLVSSAHKTQVSPSTHAGN